MVYITGDTHGDFARFRAREIRRLKRTDTLIICGDFGFVQNGSSAEQKLLEKIGKLRCTTLFVDGSHDNLPRIRTYPREAWNGGAVHRIAGNLLYAVRGSVFTLEGKTFFTLGGGMGEDWETRTEGENWWPEELPGAEELAFAAANLAAHGGQVDYLITHQPSADLLAFLTGEQRPHTRLDDFFAALPAQCRFTHWYFGYLHRDMAVSPRHTAVFCRLLPLS